MKLSKAQLEIITLMQAGWEMGKSEAFSSNHAWVQKDGVGRGGESKNMSIATFTSLLEKKMIEIKHKSFPTSKYQLTDLGKNYKL